MHPGQVVDLPKKEANNGAVLKRSYASVSLDAHMQSRMFGKVRAPIYLVDRGFKGSPLPLLVTSAKLLQICTLRTFRRS